MYARALYLAADAATDPYSALIGLGPIGVMMFLFIIGKIRTEGEVKKLQEEKHELKAEVAVKDQRIEALTASIIEQAMPALTRSADLLARIGPLLHEGQR